jgi:hypothetical protein
VLAGVQALHFASTRRAAGFGLDAGSAQVPLEPLPPAFTAPRASPSHRHDVTRTRPRTRHEAGPGRDRYLFSAVITNGVALVRN